jgi:sulfur-carrier protein
MPRLTIASSLRRHVDCPGSLDLPGARLADLLEAAFRQVPQLRGYVLDDQGAVRQHVNVFIDARAIADRSRLDVPLAPDAQVALFQALTGG